MYTFSFFSLTFKFIQQKNVTNNDTLKLYSLTLLMVVCYHPFHFSNLFILKKCVDGLSSHEFKRNATFVFFMTNGIRCTRHCVFVLSVKSVCVLCVPAAESGGAALQGAVGPKRRVLEEAGGAAAVGLLSFLPSG